MLVDTFGPRFSGSLNLERARDKLDPREVGLCAATMAVIAYVVAEMPDRLPR